MILDLAKRAARRAIKLVNPPPPTSSPVKSVTSEPILQWMRFINPGMLRAGNIELIAHCVENLPSSAPIVEIGSFAGLSLNHIIHYLRRANRSNAVFSVDEWRFENAYPGHKIDGSNVNFDDYRTHVIETFERNICLFSADRLPHHIQLSSDAFFTGWQQSTISQDYFGRSITLGGPISFAYVDGDHTYAQSKADFENVDRYLQPGGFIIFDDSSDSNEFGSTRTAQEVIASPHYRLVAKNPNVCVQRL